VNFVRIYLLPETDGNGRPSPPPDRRPLIRRPPHLPRRALWFLPLRFVGRLTGGSVASLPQRPPPASCSGFLLRAEPPFPLACRYPRLRMVFLPRHVVDALLLPGDVPLMAHAPDCSDAAVGNPVDGIRGTIDVLSDCSSWSACHSHGAWNSPCQMPILLDRAGRSRTAGRPGRASTSQPGGEN